MGIRSWARDLFILYLSFEILRRQLIKEIKLSFDLTLIIFLIVFLTAWFILEKIGILPKIT